MALSAVCQSRPNHHLVTNHLSLRHPRRVILFTGLSLTSSLKHASDSRAIEAGDWTSPGLASSPDNGIPKFVKLDNGVQIQELLVGKGRPAENGDRVEVNYVLRRSNGYFIYSTVEGVSFQPRDVPVGPIDIGVGAENVIPGLSAVLVGMQIHGRRRALIPGELGYGLDTNRLPQPPTFAAKRQILNHAREPLLFEIELLKIREK